MIHIKNAFEIRGDVTAIFMSKGNIHLETLISTADLKKVNGFPNTWYPHWCRCTKSFYVRGDVKRSSIRLHRFLLDCPGDYVVDHINHDTLNNTRSNLRIVTKSQNSQNRKGAQSNSSTGIRGVHFNKEKKKWSAQIHIKRKKIHLGYFIDISEAEKAVVKARKKLMFLSEETL